MNWILWTSGCAVGGLLGFVANHFIVARPLMLTIGRMRYAGFMGDVPPAPPGEPRLTVRED
jgi:hypothetical protein